MGPSSKLANQRKYGRITILAFNLFLLGGCTPGIREGAPESTNPITTGIHFSSSTRGLSLTPGFETGGTDPYFTLPQFVIDAREGHSTVLLPNGKLLIAGGSYSSVNLLDPSNGAFSTTGSLATNRYRFPLVLLQDGRAMAIGGGNNLDQARTTEIYNPVTGTWTAAGSLNDARGFAQAVRLNDGKVLVAGGHDGWEALLSAELFDPTTGLWSLTSSMSVPRYLHSMTVLNDGRVLVAGGHDDNVNHDSAEIYDPATGNWTAAAPLSEVRSGHSAVLLANGKVLVSGTWSTSPTVPGVGSSARASAEIYDPVDNTWTVTGDMVTGRHDHTTVRLPNGKVLAIGGAAAAAWNTGIANVEIYDPALGTWSATGSTSKNRLFHSTNLLPDGRVFVFGGANFINDRIGEYYDPASGVWSVPYQPAQLRRYHHGSSLLSDGRVLITGGVGNEPVPGGYGSSVVLSSAEIYDPATHTFTSAGTIAGGISYHVQLTLHGGQVLLIGGRNAFSQLLSSTVLFDPATASWSASGAFAVARDATSFTATLLDDGRVLVAGGMDPDTWEQIAAAEIYSPQSGTWSSAAPMNVARSWFGAARLANGRVLVVGGYDDNWDPLGSAEIYDPATDSWTLLPTPMIVKRAEPVAPILLANGRVLIAGGWDENWNQVTSAEIYDPGSNSFSATGSMARERTSYGDRATLLPSGHVLMTGGSKVAELYDPALGTFVSVGDLHFARGGHTAQLLLDGRVMIHGAATGIQTEFFSFFPTVDLTPNGGVAPFVFELLYGNGTLYPACSKFVPSYDFSGAQIRATSGDGIGSAILTLERE